MCGIAGLLNSSSMESSDLERSLELAVRAMHRRGPDASRCVSVSSDGWVGSFGHARLSIIDLSVAANQPMWSLDKNFLLVFNGEIFNYIELRAELERLGHRFSTRSDTEVLLVAWQQWGRSAITKLEGMFAFAVLDVVAGKLHLVRDGFGIKPLFYSVTRNGIAFASDLSAMRELIPGSLSPNWQRAYDYLVHGDYDSNDQSFCEGVSHLPPACLVVFDAKTGKLERVERWWNPDVTPQNTLSFSDAADEFRGRFIASVKRQMRSDVPLGAALSGGLDSSSIVCAMRYLEPDADLFTFSYIAPSESISEEYWIDRVNDHCRTKSHKVTCSQEDLQRDLVDLILCQGEPFGGTSIYAQYAVYRAAREAGITVTLDGQGADELLGGYGGYPGPRFRSLLESEGPAAALAFINKWGGWPGRSRRMAAMYIASEYLEGALYTRARALYGRAHVPSWVNRPFVSEHGLLTHQKRYDRRGPGSMRGRRMLEVMSSSLTGRGLPGLLRHGDRNSMRFSVESRVPFLTPSMCDFLYSLPEHYLVSRSGETKSILRAALRGIVPDDVLERKDKIGFATDEATLIRAAATRHGEEIGLFASDELVNGDQVKAMLGKLTSVGLKSLWRIINYKAWRQQLRGA